MHDKEKVMAPILENELGVHCFLSEGLDTDSLGTFSGEIPRVMDALATARKKCTLAMDLANCDLAIASEGSFGAHPEVFFASADEELVLLVDRKNQIEILGRSLSFATNFSGKIIYTETELWDFAAQARFPSHGLILRPSQETTSEVVKGITSPEVLLKAFRFFKTQHDSLFIETDMRALYNPTRMEVIKAATHKVVQNAVSLCPKCATPGFSVTDVRLGLPCSWCRGATNSVLSHGYECQKCAHTTEKQYPHQKKTEDPQFCNYCNP